MKKKDLQELKTKSIGELNKLLDTLLAEKQTAGFEAGQGKNKNVHIVWGKRKDIARVKTIISAKLFFQRETEDGTD